MVLHLLLHMVSFSLAVASVFSFGYLWSRPATTRFFALCLFLILGVFSLTGIWCAVSAWHLEPKSRRTCLPLRTLPRWLGIPLLIPFGLGQCVLIELAVDELRRRSTESHVFFVQDGEIRATGRSIHGKAILSMIEGFLLGLCLFCTVLGIEFPRSDPLTPIHHHSLLDWAFTFAVPVALFGSGVALLSLDMCLSTRIAENTRTLGQWSNVMHVILHITFRTAEIWFRVTLFALSIVMFCNFVSPVLGFVVVLFIDSLITLFLIAVHGGTEVRWLFRLLCVVPCVFADIFIFIDSPNKRRAARNLSHWLILRNMLECVALSTLLVLCDDLFWKNLKLLWATNPITLSMGAAATCAYPLLMCWVVHFRVSRKKDIFTACENGDQRSVVALTAAAAVGFNINCRDVFDKTPLMLAANGGYADICQSLLQDGALVEERTRGRHIWKGQPYGNFRHTESGWNALHFASHHGHEQVLTVLLAGVRDCQGDAVFEQHLDDYGATPLHIAAWMGHQDVVRSLLEYCPHMAVARDSAGFTPQERARSAAVQRLFDFPLETSGMVRRRPPRPDDSNSSRESGPVIFNITRSSVGLDAPGLCSFVAGSSGGVLSDMFQLLDCAFSSLRVVHEDAPMDSAASLRAGAPTSVNSSSHQSQSPSRSGPSMEDLEPVNVEGVVIDTRRRNEPLAGRCARPPSQAVIGEGSFGIVWRARDRVSGNIYAVKIIEGRRRSRAALAMRDAEAAELVRVHPHPCLVNLYLVHHFVEERFFMLVMEYCSDGDLTEQIQRAMSQRRSYQPPRRSMSWLAQAFLGMEHLHLTAQALLRDLKAENVVIDARNRAKLIDFGLARMSTESDGSWTFGVPPGSPGYISPEIVRGEKYGPAADIYSYGVMTWVLLTGGVLDQIDPCPPITKRTGIGFSAYADDWRLLHRAVDKPERCSARPLPNDAAKDFVVKLTQRRPERRLNHAAIRNHPLMRPLRIPGYKSRRHIVDAWLFGDDGL